jgi:predicted Co/Zn/Cd cation transporter (cation efflux family)
MKDWSIWSVIVASIFALITSIYSLYNGGNKKTNTISIVIFSFILITGIIRLVWINFR